MQKVILFFAATMIVGIAHAGKRLTGNELKSFYTDTTLSGVHFRFGQSKTYFAPDGSVQTSSDGKGNTVGKWWIKAPDKRCIRWNHKNKDLCHYTERNSNGTYTLVHGKSGIKLVEINSAQKGNQL